MLVYRIRNFLREKRLLKRQKYYQKRIPNSPDDITIISSNCLGGIIYHDLSKQFLSPTINLTFESKDFLRFCEHLDSLPLSTLVEDTNNNHPYPVGLLSMPCLVNPIRIHFVHYSTFEDAKKTFEKRSKRINPNKTILLFSILDLDFSLISRFEKIPSYKKLCIYKNNIDSCVLPNRADCKFIQIMGKIPANKDMLSFKTILGRKMYLDDVDFDYHSFLFQNNN